MFILKIFSFSILKPISPFQPSIAFHIETSHLFWKTKQLTGFYMKRNTGMKLVDCVMMVNGIFICLIFICLNFPQGDHPYIYCFYDILLLFKSVQGGMGSLKITTFERARTLWIIPSSYLLKHRRQLWSFPKSLSSYFEKTITLNAVLGNLTEFISVMLSLSIIWN